MRILASGATLIFLIAACGSSLSENNNLNTCDVSCDIDAAVDTDGAFVDSSLEASDEGGSSDADKPFEASVTCGGSGVKCKLGQKCSSDEDCEVACSYASKCIDVPSCKSHFGGDTCGAGEVGTPGAAHESCCRTLLVTGFSDAVHPGKSVYLDKYEITAGRMRAFITDITKRMGGKPNVRTWIAVHKPTIWNGDWGIFLPSDVSGDLITINRLLLGDPRHDGETNPGPGVIVPPAADQVVDFGLNFQFGAQVYADTHGNNCGLFSGAYGFPTFYYPADVLKRNNEVPRDPSLKDVLDSKSINCVTNAMLAAFCAWDGGQLATAEVVEFVTGGPDRPDSVSGCGTQYDNHGALLGNILSGTVQSGGRCPSVSDVNVTFDAGDVLPVPNSFLNFHNYHFPDLGPTTSDKVWQIAAPGRVLKDVVRINPADEPWMDLAGNLSESVYTTSTGRFGLKHRGIGYGSSRSDLNVTLMPGETILRVQRPEVKSGLTGGRCMRFR